MNISKYDRKFVVGVIIGLTGKSFVDRIEELNNLLSNEE